MPKEFDLLSIDVDYSTYWVWKAIKGYSPRIVVVEYNASIPPTKSLAVKPNSKAMWDGTNYFGASLLAMEKLGKEKGYSLIGCDSKGINAFFVRDDLKGKFKVKNAKEAYKPPRYGVFVKGRFIGHPKSDRIFVNV